jgi:hypothetical protein
LGGGKAQRARAASEGCCCASYVKLNLSSRKENKQLRSEYPAVTRNVTRFDYQELNYLARETEMTRKEWRDVRLLTTLGSPRFKST